MKPFHQRLRTGIVLLILLVSGCSSIAPEQVARLFPSIAGPAAPTRTPFQPLLPTPTRTVTPTLTPAPIKELTVWLDPALPQALRAQIHLPQDVREEAASAAPETASLQIGALRGERAAAWVYALVAPFPTLVDDVSVDEIQRAWKGETGEIFSGPLLMADSTRAALEARWGPPGQGRLRTLPADQILDAAWPELSSVTPGAFAIIPFEEIEPQWKVLHVGGMSLFDKNLNIEDYPLTVWFGVSGSPEALNLLREKTGGDASLLPANATNRDINRMTVLAMTGVTALGRATAYKMDVNGTTYPGRDIKDWLTSADLTHISNEVSFNPDCPKANFMDTSTMFCSRPEYIELLDYVGTDIVELSGNHNNDWGRRADSYSLDLYKKRGWTIFAGGANLAEARQPAKIENNGNRLAFIGCNPVGPPAAWATADEPGAAPCGDYGWMLDAIRQVRAEGYLPIATFQYFEDYVHQPGDHQVRDFRAAVDAGAVIVSGSQAHFPQTMEFYDGGFIHYGLGNLFFDQMDIPVPGTRKEFIDRHIFYNGKYLGVELLTALLEDYARPRPMTPEERLAFLQEIFSAGGW